MYNKKQIDEFKKLIIEQISIGKSLNSLVEQKKVPSHQTVYNWLNEEHENYDKIFLDNYARARQDQADFYADEIIEISDDSRNDYMEKLIGEEVVQVVNQENIQRARLRIDARKWVSSKLKPKKYGDKLDMTTGGEKIEVVIKREKKPPIDER